MNLVKCPYCGKDSVWREAENCPKCGKNIKEYFKKLKIQQENQAKRRSGCPICSKFLSRTSDNKVSGNPGNYYTYVNVSCSSCGYKSSQIESIHDDDIVYTCRECKKTHKTSSDAKNCCYEPPHSSCSSCQSCCV